MPKPGRKRAGPPTVAVELTAYEIRNAMTALQVTLQRGVEDFASADAIVRLAEKLTVASAALPRPAAPPGRPASPS